MSGSGGVSKSGVDYTKLATGAQEDKRFQRNRGKECSGAIGSTPGMSSTMDALHRMQAGLESRTVRDQINDPNRPTWEQYKKVYCSPTHTHTLISLTHTHTLSLTHKDNADKLNISGQDAKKMEEYRKQLDKERETRLARKPQTNKGNSCYDDDGDGDGDGAGDDASDSGSEGSEKRRERKRAKKDKKKAKKEAKKVEAHTLTHTGATGSTTPIATLTLTLTLTRTRIRSRPLIFCTT